MKLIIVFVACFGCLKLSAQLQQNMRLHTFQKETYFSFNPLGLIEPQIAVGLGFGSRFSSRSEYIGELSYLNKNPLYNESINSFKGFRWIAQYRYHFLQNWKYLRIRSKERAARLDPFIGFEFRLKRFQFSDKASFINHNTSDTLSNFLYTASATSLGGAIVFGHTYPVGTNGKWKIEVTAGFGVKQKLVNIESPSSGYEVIDLRGYALAPPDHYKSVSSPYIPFAIRLRYVIN